MKIPGCLKRLKSSYRSGLFVMVGLLLQVKSFSR
jgi:hypothetical protein